MDTLNKILARLEPEISPQTVTVYTRHNPACSKREDNSWKRCNCPKSVYVFQGGKDFRFSASTRSWDKAEKLKREIEDALDPVKSQLRKLVQENETRRIKVEFAVERYLSDAATRNLHVETLRILKRLFTIKLISWTKLHNLTYLDDLTTDKLGEWRDTWKLASITKLKDQERVRAFFRFCLHRGWLKANPAALLTRIKANQIPTDYFTPQEFDRILAATKSFKSGPDEPKGPNLAERLRVMILLMRWSGFRIGDAVTLKQSDLVGDRILLYQAKTKVPVYVPLPPDVAEALRNVPPGRKPNPHYFFWSGNGTPHGATSNWSRMFKKLFDIADIREADGNPKRCHPHMFRDTFAVEMLLSGVRVEQVSALLGHSSIKITEKHYLPWVRARQEQLENCVREAWSKRESVLPERADTTR